MEGYGIIEVWFNNGHWRQFPKVVKDSLYIDDYQVTFVFGNHEHQASIIKANVDFMEFMFEEQ